jgi:hypothetical protein
MCAELSNCRGFAPTRIEWAAFPPQTQAGCPGRSAARPRNLEWAERKSRGALQTRDRSGLWRSRLSDAPRAPPSLRLASGVLHALVLHRIRDTRRYLSARGPWGEVTQNFASINGQRAR